MLRFLAEAGGTPHLLTGRRSLALASRPVSATATVFTEGKGRAQPPGSPFGGVDDLVSHPYGFLSLLLLISPFLGQGHGFGFRGHEPNGVIVGPAQAGAPACGRPRRFCPPHNPGDIFDERDASAAFHLVLRRLADFGDVYEENRRNCSVVGEPCGNILDLAVLSVVIHYGFPVSQFSSRPMFCNFRRRLHRATVTSIRSSPVLSLGYCQTRE